MTTPIFQEVQDDLRVKLENFTKLLNKQPKQEELHKTPDGKAYHYPISYVEMSLDEIFFGLWSTENFKWSAIQNEVQGSIDLVVFHPMTGFTIRRTGAASVQIMVDATPEEIKNDKQAKNAWSIDVLNKKPNALDMGFPKLKAECVKNAALSLGKAFGRDINRKLVDEFNPLISGSDKALMKTIESAINSNRFESARSIIESSKLAVEVKNELLSRLPKGINLERVDSEKQAKRILDHINGSRSLEELEEVYEHVRDYNYLDLYTQKRDELTTNTSK